jgi:hypothetical protein
MKKLIYFTLVLIAAIAVSLAFHLQDVKSRASVESTKQLGRIDIAEEYYTQEALNIVSEIKTIPGVTHSFYNPQSRRLIFSFNPQEHDTEEIFQAFKAKTNAKASLYQPSGKLAQSECPF